MTFGILALGFPVSEVLQLFQPLGAHSLTFFPIYLPYLHAFLRWRLASWLWGSLFCSFCSLWGLTVSLSSLYLPYLHAFLRWRLASWLWGSLFRRFCSFCSLWGLTVSLSSLYLPYLTAFLRWRLASWLWGSLFCSLWGLTVSLSSLYIFPIFMHSLGDVWHPGSGVPCFAAFGAFGDSRRFCRFRRFCIPIFMHSLGDVWHPGSGVPCFGGFAAFAAFGGLTEVLQVSQVLHPYLHAFLRWRLASWLWGSLFCSFCSLWGLTVSLSSLYLPYLTAFLRWRLASWLWVPCFAAFAAYGGSQSHFLPYIFPIFMHSLGDVWHPGSGVPCFGGFAAFAAFGGLTEVLQVSQVLHPYLPAFLRWRLASWLWGSLFCSFCSLWGLTVSLSSLYLPYLHAFLRWRLASWLWGSLFRRFCSFCSLWGLTVSLSSLYIFPIFMHSLGDVWHPYLNAFLRWRLASWLWGSLFRRFCSFCSLWGLTVSLSSLFRRFCSLWGLTVSLSSLYIFPIFMHSLGDVWHPGSGVPCFGGFAAFAAFGGSQSHFLPYISSLSSCIP